MNKSICILGLYMLLSQCVYPGAWTREKGKGYQQLSFTYLKYGSIINGSDESKKIKRAVTDYTLQYYLEYGITDKLTFVSVVPFKILETAEELSGVKPEEDILPYDTAQAGTLNGLSNMTFGLKYLLVNKAYVLSAQMKIGTATFQYDDSSGLRTGYESWLLTPTLLYGKGWDGSYITTELGYQFKTNNYADNLIANVEYGVSINWNKTKTWLAFVLDAVVPLDVGSFSDGNAIHTGLYRNGEGYVSPGIKINHYLSEHFIFGFASYGAIWADHGGAAPTLNFSMAYEW